jgi:hypothetical protein
VSGSDKCGVGQMSVEQTSVGQTSVAKKSRHQVFDVKMSPSNFMLVLNHCIVQHCMGFP